MSDPNPPPEIPTALPAAPPRSEERAAPAADDARPAADELAADQRATGGGVLQQIGACAASMILHCLVLIVLALWMLPEVRKAVMPQLEISRTDPIEEQELTVELDQRQEASTEVAPSAAAGAPTGMAAYLASLDVRPELDQRVVEEATSGGDAPRVAIDLDLPTATALAEELPQGALGDFRAVVDDYEHAMDRITQEILLLMSKQKVLVIWCFDQSDSMKDDQAEIRDRIERVYTELGLTGETGGDVLTTAIVSYGEKFQVHTRIPTADVEAIRRAIDQVPSDRSGKEMMCQAVGSAIVRYQSYALKTRRRVALVLVTDESGDPENNLEYLEQSIEAAKGANCSVYVLGREAVFGYPYAHIRWQHPQTRVVHWLPVHRGPETAFVEQLQTNGFHRRRDAFPSGFGPYGQSRIATETGGIFFMLPSVESNLVRGEKRRYELEQMRIYRPDLRSRAEVVQDRDLSALRRGVYQIIGDLNPYRPEVAKVIEVRVHFSRDVPTFLRQVEIAKRKIPPYVVYLDRAARGIEALQELRARETSPRWQANIDLLHAQLLAYKARIYEYGAYLDWFVKNPRTVPLTKPPDRYLRWDIRVRRETLTEELIAETVAASSALFEKVVAEHAGTPWAARAQWELDRGFGVQLVPTYHAPARKVTGPLIPIPKL